MIHPLQDQRKWSPIIGDPLSPPLFEKTPRQTQKKQEEGADEPSSHTSFARKSLNVKCKICKEFGHNKRTYQKAPVKAEQAASQARTVTSLTPQVESEIGLTIGAEQVLIHSFLVNL